MKRTSVLMGRTTNLQPEFKQFYETFLRVDGAPSDKPYAQPFSENPPSEANKWFNTNVAGSYAPSSLRGVSPFLRAGSIRGGGRKARYSLNEKHWELARMHLCYGDPVPVIPLAVFLYRDYAIEKDDAAFSDLVEIFRHEFGYARADTGEDNVEFAHLFLDDRVTRNTTNWLQLVP